MVDDDEYIIELAKKILSTDDSKHSKLLIDLAKYIESILEEKDAIKAIMTVGNKNLLPIMLLEIKKDYSNMMPGSWRDGFLMLHAIYSVLTRIIFATKEAESHLRSRLIPDFIENILCFYRHLQSNYNESLIPDYRGLLSCKELLKEITKVLELAESFVIRFPEYILTFIESPWFLQVFITDNDETSLLIADWLMKIIKIKPAVVKQINKSTVTGIGNVLLTLFDEVIYHLAVSSNPKLIEMNLKCLLTILEADPSLTSMLHSRYKGLKLLILKWSMPLNEMLKNGLSNSFANNLRTMIKYLDTGMMFHADASMNVWAIIKIQAWWRSAALRLKLNKTNKAFSKFQKDYRHRKLKERQDRSKHRIRRELEHQINITRQRRFRQKLEAEVLLMETLPAPIVFRHLEKVRQEAATTIQATWRGCRERFQLISRQKLYKKTQAALKIQKCARAWLSRRELAETNSRLNKNDELGIWNIPGLTVDRKAELIKMQNKWMASHKHEFKGMSDDAQLELHHRAQKLYRHHLYAVKSSRRQDAERELTLARLEMDSKLLITAPNLNDAAQSLKTGSDANFRIDNFHCKIRPIANRALQLHNDRINTIQKPWWKQLLVEEPLDLEADDNLLSEPVDLDQYMILRNRLDFLKTDDPSLVYQ